MRRRAPAPRYSGARLSPAALSRLTPAGRPLLLSAALLALAGCSLFGEDRVREAIVQDVTVEALPLGLPWDRPAPDTDPDVYVDVKSPGRTLLEGPYARTTVAGDVRAAGLPLRLTASLSLPVPVEAPVYITVNDQDVVEDDLMFRSDTLTFAGMLRPEDRPGTGRTLVFENAETRVLVRVVWR